MKVYISATLKNFFERNSVIDVPKKNIRDILTFLTDEYVESKKVLFDAEENLRSFVQIYAGDENRTDRVPLVTVVMVTDDTVGIETDVQGCV